jgi:hypothetical protein
MAQELKTVKLTNGGLHESSMRGGTIILRGVIDKDCLKHLRFDDYQREALPLSSLSKLTQALKAGNALPDIEIGMRGHRVDVRKDDWFLKDSCYVIDGQQRVNACINTLSLFPGTPVYLGATIHFDTTKEWERERFRILNNSRVKVSPNVLLRNMREDYRAIAEIYRLTNVTDDYFVLGGRVSWDQNMKRGKLLTALNVLKITGILHGHISAGQAMSIENVAVQLDNLAERIKLPQLKENIKTFFDLVDEVWGVRVVQYRELSPHLRGGFLMMLARFLSNHLDFWRGPDNHKLFIEADTKRKMGTFPINDPGIAPLTSSAGASRHVLLDYFIKHINSGRRTKKLQLREGLLLETDVPEIPEIATEGEGE